MMNLLRRLIGWITWRFHCLMPHDKIRLKGKYTVQFYHKGTNKLAHTLATKNLVVLVGKQFALRLLLWYAAPATHGLGLTYQAIGTGTTAPASGNTQLATEFKRLIVTSRPDTASNVGTWSTFFAAADSTVHIKELGIFGDTTASASANSGVLFSRALLDYDNSAGLYDLVVTYSLTLT